MNERPSRHQTPAAPGLPVWVLVSSEAREIGLCFVGLGSLLAYEIDLDLDLHAS
ncbi:hypothetical protein ACFY2J_39490 [Streptomyces collinus]|uniref:hypothetical protein n=1 Tax=Streptomyces collinus TaxID=42684 RepID=UPI0036A6BBC1